MTWVIHSALGVVLFGLLQSATNAPTPPKPADKPPELVETTIDPIEQDHLDSIWKDMEIAKLKIEMEVQSILSKNPTYSYDFASRKFFKPAPKKEEKKDEKSSH